MYKDKLDVCLMVLGFLTWMSNSPGRNVDSRRAMVLVLKEVQSEIAKIMKMDKD